MTTVSDVTICNSALLKMGADTITSLSGSSRAAIVCNTLYDILRDEVMGSAPWRFAIKRATLTNTGTAPDFGYDYQFNVPADCLRLLRTDDDESVWVQEGAMILSDDDELDMIYLYRNEDETSWDARFCEAFSWRIAMELALSLTQSSTMKQMAEQSYRDALAQARSMNAVIGTIPVLIADVWSDARKGNSAWRATDGQTT